MRTIITTLTLLGILCASSPAGITIGFKGGVSEGDNPLTGDSEITSRWELEVLGPRWLDGHLALTGAMLMPRSETMESTRITVLSNEPPRTIRRHTDEETTFWDFRLGVTYWPWPEAAVKPYVAAGFGWLLSDSEIRSRALYDLNNDGVGPVLESTSDKDVDEEWYSWLSLGLELPIAEHFSFLAEVQYDWAKTFRDTEIGGLSFLAGLRWQW